MNWLSLVWLLPVVMLGIALMPMPYAYYGLLRVVVCTVTIFLAVRSFQHGQHIWTWVFVAMALLYNPITSVSLGRPLWTGVNLVTIAAVGWHWWTTERGREL